MYVDFVSITKDDEKGVIVSLDREKIMNVGMPAIEVGVYVCMYVRTYVCWQAVGGSHHDHHTYMSTYIHTIGLLEEDPSLQIHC